MKSQGSNQPPKSNNTNGHGSNKSDKQNNINNNYDAYDNNNNRNNNQYSDIVVSRVNHSKSKTHPKHDTKNVVLTASGDINNRIRNPIQRKLKKRLTNKQLITRIVAVFVSVILVLAVGLTLLYNYMFSGLNVDKPGEIYPTEALTYQPPESKDITNILLLGVDARKPEKENGLSDSIIILTIDGKNGVIKMTSIMRDCYVYIPGHKNPDKINAAHSFGGPELAMRTINNTLRLNIKKYMVVNFFSMADIVDLAGGVTITINKKEKDHINKLLKEDYYSLATKYLLSNTGTQMVNGKQAVEYARIRKIDSDSERARRQRAVLSALFKSFKDVNPVKKAQLIQKGLSLVKTNMTPGEITSLAIDVLPKMSTEIQQMRLPIEGLYKVNNVGVWYMNVDYNATIPEVYKFIYGEVQPFDLVPTMPYHQNTVKVTNTPNSNGPEEPFPTTGVKSSSESVSDSSSVSSDPTLTLSPTPETSSSDSISSTISTISEPLSPTPTLPSTSS